MLKSDFHVHLHGCLTPEELWSLGKNTYKNRIDNLEIYAQHYEKAWGRRPDYRAYWEKENGIEILKKDYLFEEPHSFSRFQANFNLIIALCPITPENFNIQEQIIRRVNSEGLSFFEARTLIPFYFSAEQAYTYLEGLCKKVISLNAELAMQTHLVFSLFRDNDTALKHYHWIREFITRHPDLGEIISGIDFAYDEENNPPKDKTNIFQKFTTDNKKQKKLNLLYHVGESFTDKSILSAIRWIYEAYDMGADRLGHAIALGINPFCYRKLTFQEKDTEYYDSLLWLREKSHLLKEHGYEVDTHLCKKKISNHDKPSFTIYTDEYLEDIKRLQIAIASIFREKKVIIECCPTSNRLIGQIKDLTHHPLHFFHKEKLEVVIGTDDPGIFNTDWKKEFDLTQELLVTTSF